MKRIAMLVLLVLVTTARLSHALDIEDYTEIEQVCDELEPSDDNFEELEALCESM